jgi:Antitoxin Xre/MbcA/ParS C-terminal toxin-binding domain/Antitoxin Xre-like helix-turn-helix domain
MSEAALPGPRIAPAETPAPRSSRVTREETAAMMRAAFALFGKWAIGDAEARVLLGQPSPSTFYRWKRGELGTVPADTVWRLGDLIGIHKALRTLFTDPERGYAWVRRPSLAFGGQSALARMLAGAPADLAAVRSYLDAERGAW